jgi:hypothetical protein
LAHSYFNGKKYDQAVFLFQQLTSGSSVYNYPSDWYLALSYLALNDHDKSRKQLEAILKDKDHPYYAEAAQLKKKMR